MPEPQRPEAASRRKLETAVFVRMTSDEHDRIRKLAEAENRTISGQTRHLIRRALSHEPESLSA